MVMRYCSYDKAWKDVQLAGPNPTSAPPIDPSFYHHLDVISHRLNRQHRPHWNAKYGCWCIQAQEPNGEWRNVYIACDDARSHEGNLRPYMPLDLRVIHDFANGCLEIKYNTGDIEKDRQMDQIDRDMASAAAEAAQHEAGIAEMARNLVAGASGGDPEDNRRAAKAIRYSTTVIRDGTGFKEIFQVPKSAPTTTTSEAK